MQSLWCAFLTVASLAILNRIQTAALEEACSCKLQRRPKNLKFYCVVHIFSYICFETRVSFGVAGVLCWWGVVYIHRVQQESMKTWSESQARTYCR